MNKLTKEQADWLIGQLGNQSFDLYGIHPNSRESGKGFSYESIEEVINQCTEKVKPSFNILDWNVYVVGDGVQMRNPISQHWFTKDEFQQFTDGCSKIVEYLNEQNC